MTARDEKDLRQEFEQREVIRAFVRERLNERSAIEWALTLRPTDVTQRRVILDLMQYNAVHDLSEPWISAWRLIEEAWTGEAIGKDGSHNALLVAKRVRSGDTSGALVNTITSLVTPTVQVASSSQYRSGAKGSKKRPRYVNDLISVRLSSNSVIDPSSLSMQHIVDAQFLRLLTNELDAIVFSGLLRARKIFGSNWSGSWRIGGLNRVYYVPAEGRGVGEHEPDEFHRGLAPAVKLLFAAVTRLADLELPAAINIAKTWKLNSFDLYIRLWAAISRDTRITSAAEVSAFLLSVDDEVFWNFGRFPEVAELRAVRFSHLSLVDQQRVTARVLSLPPQRKSGRRVEIVDTEEARKYSAVRELKRIQVSGAVLPLDAAAVLADSLAHLPHLRSIDRIDSDFIGTSKAFWVPPNPDPKYSDMVGLKRLVSLNEALTTPRQGWDENPAKGAGDWIAANAPELVDDLLLSSRQSQRIDAVWEKFGWHHKPAHEESENARDTKHEADVVVEALQLLSAETLHNSIEGISHWFETWKGFVVTQENGILAWCRVWEFATERTNLQQAPGETIHLDTVVSGSKDEPSDLDVYNTPVGKMMEAFFAAMPDLRQVPQPFTDEKNVPRKLRDAIDAASGRASLIVKYRLIEHLDYFYAADADWAQNTLINPLRRGDNASRILWRAIAHRMPSAKVLRIVGEDMAKHATSPVFSREAREAFASYVIFDLLLSYENLESPAVPPHQVQQMIRMLDDEARVAAASALQKYVNQRLSECAEEEAKLMFERSVVPFLRNVWPQEHSLVTPGISHAFAMVPASVTKLFAEVVAEVSRFLVPFDCWSLVDFGFFKTDQLGEVSLADVDDPFKASALLTLLDLTVGRSDGSVIPYDLAKALEHIQNVSPKLGEMKSFQRLATAARRI